MAVSGFQTTIQKYPARGVPGSKATLNPFVYTPRTFVAHDDTVFAGRFIWPLEPQVVGDNGVPNDTAWRARGVSPATGTKVAGLVERNQSVYNYGLRDGGTLNMPPDAKLNTIRKGDVYVTATTVATIGQTVYANELDGTIATDDAGATVADHVETTWKVTDITNGGAAGELITISSWED